MTDLVARARAALDGVTPGEWHPEECEVSGVWHIDAGAYPVGTSICRCESESNARFIAAARSLVPDMADRIEALEAENAKAEALLAEAVGVVQQCLNFIENTESEMGETLYSGDRARAFLAALTPEARHD